ncbi:hypothetical protein DFP72DRAFT_931251 [Ephemerocybe angulata]|uniref:BHLH domain-containing protein n=1 Tax=Ephemerocybe angulata TaxID=980116 RepID=A0A8H6HCW5_9AGAR|nr:hypothetical protein DFP72DRAFT_931251 [Tulosesus angulatus]
MAPFPWELPIQPMVPPSPVFGENLNPGDSPRRLPGSMVPFPWDLPLQPMVPPIPVVGENLNPGDSPWRLPGNMASFPWELPLQPMVDKGAKQPISRPSDPVHHANMIPPITFPPDRRISVLDALTNLPLDGMRSHSRSSSCHDIDMRSQSRSSSCHGMRSQSRSSSCHDMRSQSRSSSRRGMRSQSGSSSPHGMHSQSRSSSPHGSPFYQDPGTRSSPKSARYLPSFFPPRHEDAKGGSNTIGQNENASGSSALRASHKLGERKRRKEMKELFDDLRDQLPQDRATKASKWEILTKAIEFVGHLKAQNQSMSSEIELLRRENDSLRQGGMP